MYSMCFSELSIEIDGKQVTMQVSKKAEINLATFRKMPYILPRQEEILQIKTDEKTLDEHNTHFRLLSIYPQKVYSIKSQQQDAQTLAIDTKRYKQMKILQVFHKGLWYSVLLDKPTNILHKCFGKIDIKKKNLEIAKIQKLLKQARKAFPLDDKLKTIEMELNNRAANEFNKTSNHMQQGVIF